MFNKTIERWKELREDGFGRLSVKGAIIFMIREKIEHKYHSFIVNRYGKDCGYLRDILNTDDKDTESLPLKYRYKHLHFLYNDAKEDTKEDILNKLMVSVKLLYDYQALHIYTSSKLKTSAKTEQYYKAEWKIYRETQIWTDWGECEGFMTDGYCKHCDNHIKIESDRIKKELKLK
tara:strand:- start:617 stop:1144 length:528 start_codon:yes stop_codon:yes gene_type:complete